MVTTLLTGRTGQARRPPRRQAARPALAVRAGPVLSHAPLIQRQQMGNGTADHTASDIASPIPGHGVPGRPLPEATRIQMESRFGADFGAVRLHTDRAAAQMSRALHAHAFTLGHDIFFARAKDASGGAAGDRLLAHELSHVVQQQRGEVPPGTIQRAHADVQQPPATEPKPEPPVVCAAEITATRTCHTLIGEMIALQADITENDRYIKEHEANGIPDLDVYVARLRHKAELQEKYRAKERVRVACCPQLEVPPPVPIPAPEPAPTPAAPSPSAAPNVP